MSTWQDLQHSVGKRNWLALPKRQRTALIRTVERMKQGGVPTPQVGEGELSDIVQSLLSTARRDHGMADAATVAVVAATVIRRLQAELREARYRDLGLREAAR